MKYNFEYLNTDTQAHRCTEASRNTKRNNCIYKGNLKF